MNTFDGSLIVLTELVPGAADLIQSAKRPQWTQQEGHKRRRDKTYQSFVPNADRQKELVWFSVILEAPDKSPCYPEFIDGPPRFLSGFKEYVGPNNCRVFTWPSNEALIRQCQRPTGVGHSDGPKTIAWHLLLPKKIYHGYGTGSEIKRPSLLFQYHRNYWAETISARGKILASYDFATPKNTVELQQRPEQLCQKCIQLLDADAPVAEAAVAAVAPPEPAAPVIEAIEDDCPTELIVEAPTMWAIADSYADVVDAFLTSIGLKV